jgi:imidazolonepropionase-like amidohydrolase
VDGTGRALRDAVVVVEGDRVTGVGTGTVAIPKGAKVIDLRRYTALPGLIDVHTHMTYYWDGQPGTSPWQQQGARNTSVTLFLAQENARRTLESGVTTVRDLGSRDFGDVAMRELINRGAMAGPRMFVSGHGLGKLRPTMANPTPASIVPRARIADPASPWASPPSCATTVRANGAERSRRRW